VRFLLLTLGTRGDVQPYLSLGLGLQRAGHDVTVCASASFAPWIRGHGLGYAHLNNDIIDLVNSQAGRRAFDRRGGLPGLLRQMVEASRNFKRIFRRTLAEQWEAAQGTDALVYHPNAVAGSHIVEALGIPGIMADPLPTWVPTGSSAHIVAPELPLGAWYNRLTHQLIGAVPGLLFGSVVSRWRRELLGLRRQPVFPDELFRSDGRPVPVILGFSRHVFPPPPDWPANVRVTGYWFLEEGRSWQPPSSLCEFLAAGPAPVFVGFGSMPGRDPAGAGRIVLEALERSGQRGLIVTGWGGMTVPDPPPGVYVADFVPYDWLLPQVAAVVHHGGAGTTAGGLRAGKPTVVCPFVADQPFWGRRVRALGAGPAPIAQRKLSVETLAAAIRVASSDPEMRRKAAELGEKIRAEDGVGDAVGYILKCVGEQ
jgi:sterol 3beta-glucosyltransferase